MTLLGKLSWDAIPFDQPIVMGTVIVLAIGIVSILGLVTYREWWPYLWSEWTTSVDHKRVGVMSCWISCFTVPATSSIGTFGSDSDQTATVR